MALGAAFRAANLSTAFRVRKVGMVDISSFGIVVRLSDAPEQPTDTGIIGSVMNMFKSEGKEEKPPSDVLPWSKHTALFPRRSPVPAKMKTVTFAHDKDIICRLEYDTDEATTQLLPMILYQKHRGRN